MVVSGMLEVLVSLFFVVLTANTDRILELVTEVHEDNDAAELHAEVAPHAEGVSSEEGDGSGNHVSTNEG